MAVDPAAMRVILGALPLPPVMAWAMRAPLPPFLAWAMQPPETVARVLPLRVLNNATKGA